MEGVMARRQKERGMEGRGGVDHTHTGFWRRELVQQQCSSYGCVAANQRERARRVYSISEF